MSQALMDLLVKEKVVAEAQVQKLRENLPGPPDLLMARCVLKGLMDDQKLLQYLCHRFELPSINPESMNISPDVAALIPLSILEQIQAIPIKRTDKTIVVAIADPTRIALVTERVKELLHKNTEIVLTTFTALHTQLKKLGILDQAPGAPAPSTPAPTRTSISKNIAVEPIKKRTVAAASIPDSNDAVAILNSVMSEAVRLGASDIHIEPTKAGVRIRVRVDGCLLDLKEFPPAMKETLIARTKVLAKLDTAERRMPQDGKVKTLIGNKEYDFRVNVLPMIYGESIVLRVISQDGMKLSLRTLGFSQEQEKTFLKGIKASHGMVLVTGPTGSGKTTTLYTALTILNDPTMKLATVEDPVEYNLEGVCQTQVNKEIGLNFAEVLRALLRQDPDVILVGEIRDNETALMGIQASLTGHLVLSTLHTNDAPSTILRLTNMGIEPILVVSAVNVVISQRLLRKLCEQCRHSNMISTEHLKSFGVSESKYQNTPVFHSKGCPDCGQTGYRGRIAVYEILDFTEELKEVVLKGENAIVLRKAAVKAGMIPLAEAALDRAISGLTSLEEALNCCVI